MKRWLCLSLVLVLVVMSAGNADARSHRFLDLNIDARVGADGLVRITETHTVKFDGTFSGMFQWFDTTRDIEVRDVVVRENGVEYTRLEGDTPGPAGTYFVREEADQVYVDWSFSATDEIRNFELSYVLHNVVLNHNDVAEFYYQFVGRRWDQPRDHVKAVLTLPFGAELDEIAAWGHGPLHGMVTIESPTRIVWEVENLPAKTFVEGRVVFPNSLVPLGTRRTGETRLQAIFDEELGKEAQREEGRRQAEARLARTQRAKRLDPYLAASVVSLSLAFFVYLWSKYGRRQSGYKERYYKTLPGDYPPAELAILLRRTVSGSDLTATLLDLARRGYLSIEETAGLQGTGKGEPSYKFIKKKDYTQEPNSIKLRSWEKDVLEFLFEAVGMEEVTLEEFQAYAKTNAESFTTFWTEWAKQVKESSKEHGFHDTQAKKALWFLVPILLAVGLGFLALGLSLFGTGIATLVMSFLALIFVVGAATRYSDYGYEEYTKWKAFRRYLKESSRVDIARVGSLGIWEEFLPYAVTLGVADQMLKQLEVRFPNLEQDGYYFGANWFVYYHAMGIGRVSHMTNKVGQSVNKVTMPQGSGGTGGGFSGGGGGGFGGGGGGVR